MGREYDSQFKVVFEAMRQLVTAPDKPPKKIGFQIREKRTAYGRRQAAPKTVRGK